MYTLQTCASFDSAHFLKGYEGKCKNIHGHRWKIEVSVSAKDLSSEGQIRGMVVDFKTLKQDLNDLADELDHSLIIERGSLKDSTMQALKEEEFKVIVMEFRPTAEHLAKYFYDKMEEKGYDVTLVNVYETPNNCAGYSREK